MNQVKSVWQHAIENTQDLIEMGHSLSSAAFMSSKMFCPNSYDVYQWSMDLIEELSK